MSNPAPRRAPAWIYLLRLGWPWAAAVLSGGLLTLGCPRWNQEWLCWVALTPLVAAIWSGGGDTPGPHAAPGAGRFRRMRAVARMWRSTPWARPFALGYLAGLVFFWCAFYWLWNVTGLGWFVLAFYMALYPAIWASFMGTVAAPRGGLGGRRRGAASFLTASPFLRSRWNLWLAFLGAAAWVGLEWVRGMMFSGFGWNELGAALHADVPFLQVAAWTGVGGLSFLVAFVNLIAIATVYRFVAEVRTHRIRPHFDFTLTLSAMLAVFAFGIFQMQRAAREQASGGSIPLKVACVQANIPQADKADPAIEARIFETFNRLTDLALASRPQLLLWSEDATSRGVFADERNYRFVMRVYQRARCNFLFGTTDFDFGANGASQADYNAAAFLPANGGDAQVYRKIHLVPFGEYVPFRNSFPLFAWIVGQQVPSDFTSGAAPAVFQASDPSVRIAPLICFEDTIGRVARLPVAMGAQLLVDITNDGWFAKSAASEQQLAESVFRAVENHRPLICCANTGVTAFVDANGRVLKTLRSENGSTFIEGFLAGEIRVPLAPAMTFYTQHGEVFSVACAAAAVLAAALGGVRQLLRPTRRAPASVAPSGAVVEIGP